MELTKYAAIDIGSNAVRLLVMNVIRDETGTWLRKSSLTRVPLRLGADVFMHKAIQPGRIDRLVHIMMAFGHLIAAHEVTAFKACATSAMREASNGDEVILQVKEKTGINIEIISGKEEAEILYAYRLNGFIRPGKTYLFTDMGGGSTEMTLFRNDRVIDSRSFNIGTVRLLLGQVKEKQFLEMKKWIKESTHKEDKTELIGSGGNINKIFKYSGKKEGKALSYKELREVNRRLSAYSVEDRIKLLGLNPDRADVIVPAAKTFIKIMKWAGSGRIWVPKIGIADGIIRQLVDDNERKTILSAANQNK